MSFIPLHVVSGYSLLKSGLTTQDIVESLKKKNYPAVGITDFANLSIIPPLFRELEKYQKQLIVGMEIPVEDDILCLYAKNEEGYRHLIKISSLYQKNERYLSYLKENHQGLIGVLETIRGSFFERFPTHKEHTFESYVFKISNIVEDFYLGLEAKNPEEFNYIKEVREWAHNHSYNTVAFPRILYRTKDDAIVIDILNAIENKTHLDIKEKSGNEYFMDEKYYRGIYGKEDVEMTNVIAKSIDFSFHQKRGALLHYPVDDSLKYLKEKCIEGLKRLDKDKEEYLSRLDYELNIISSLHYEDYFLIVQDYVSWCKNHDILVGPGRGSATGSVVSYALNITDIDPVKNGLSFERFLNVSRKNMPDIDVDFMDIKRNEVIEYISQRFGKENVAVITSFQTIKAKQSIRDIGMVYNYNPAHIDLLSKSLKEERYSLADAYHNVAAFKKLVDDGEYFLEIVSLASKIEGLPRQRSIHPSGIILNDQPLIDSIPIYENEISGQYLTQYEDKYLEEQGFLKMDILGLSNLTTIYECVHTINAREGNILDPFHIPFDEPITYQTIASGKTAGIFQLESKGMNNAIKIIKPKSYDDIIKLLALYRPGPMEDLKLYARRKEGEPFTYEIDNEAYKKVLEDTKGIVIFQEQVSAVAEAVAGFSKEEADAFRAAVSKKKVEVFKKLEDRFVEGAIKNHVSPHVAVSLFKRLSDFAGYGFNKSHAAAYAYIACEMAYLKAKYPLDFYRALFVTRTSIHDSKFSNYLDELSSFGYKILPPDINRSIDEFLIDEKGLLFPLSRIKNIPELLVEKILLERKKNGEFKSFFDFVSRMFAYKMSESNIEKLIDAGALDIFYPSRKALRESIPLAIHYAEIVNTDNGTLIALNEPIIQDVKDEFKEKLAREYDALWMVLSSNPLEFRRQELAEKGLSTIKDVDYKSAKVAGIIKHINVIRTKKERKQMAYVTIFDETGEVEVIIFNDIYKESAMLLNKNSGIIVSGYMRKNNDGEDNYSLIANKIEPLED